MHLALIATALLALAAVPFVVLSCVLYRRSPRAAERVLARFDVAVTGNYWEHWKGAHPRPPEPPDPPEAPSPLLSSSWAASVALMAAMWVLGPLAVLVVSGPGRAGTGDTLGSQLALQAMGLSIALASYAAWRHLGWGHVARYLAGGLIVTILLVAGVR
jgi:hypothetical protein